MNVLMVSDDKYAFLLAICLSSLFDMNKDIETINTYIVQDNMCESSVNKINAIALRYNRKLIMISPPSLPPKLFVRGKWSISTYYRLGIASILPKDINKVLYLDCDLIVRGNLAELWDMEIEDCYVAGVTDTTGMFAKKSLGLKKHSKYINAGVLLINLKKWREDELYGKFMAYLEHMNWSVEFNDQGVINKICNPFIKLISPKYNFLPTYQRFTRLELKSLTGCDVYGDEEIRIAKEDPKIVHFAGYPFCRPWYVGGNTQYGEEFMDYWRRSGFNIVFLRQPTNIKYSIRRIVFKMPNKIYIVYNKVIEQAYVFKTSCIMKKDSDRR